MKQVKVVRKSSVTSVESSKQVTLWFKKQEKSVTESHSLENASTFFFHLFLKSSNFVDVREISKLANDRTLNTKEKKGTDASVLRKTQVTKMKEKQHEDEGLLNDLIVCLWQSQQRITPVVVRHVNKLSFRNVPKIKIYLSTVHIESKPKIRRFSTFSTNVEKS